MEFVDFNLAKKLKKKEFKEKCVIYYDYAGESHYNYESAISNKELYFCHNKFNNIWHRDLVDAPTISQVLKWLREEKKLHIIIPASFDEGYWWEVRDFNREISEYSDIEYTSYEEVALAGIKYVLDNLI